MIRKIIKNSIILTIKFYQRYISIILGSSKCRFNPTCSTYFIEAVKKKGVIKGVALGMYRILRCNPFCSGGNDFVK